jgi:hypothetical protein
MYWIALIYIVGIVVFNLLGKTGNIYWAIQYYVFVHGLIAVMAFTLYRRSIKKGERKVWFILGCFASFYTLFHIGALSSPTFNDFLGLIDSYLWSGISALIAGLLLISYFYDTKARNGKS